MYSSFGRKIFEAKDSQSVADEIKVLTAKLRERKPSLDEFKVAFQEISYTNKNSKQKSLVRYILQKFSEHNSYKFPVDFDDLTIEHIAPQAMIGKNDWSEFDVGRIGNLIFLDEGMNGKLDKKEFKDKKTILKKNKYSVPDYVLEVNKWRPKDIIEHTRIMAEMAYNQIWIF